MSLSGAMGSMTSVSFPRVSGDEPTGAKVTQLAPGFSPRERG